MVDHIPLLQKICLRPVAARCLEGRFGEPYLPEWIATNGENTVRAILESHFISPAAFDILVRKPFTPDDFEAFISERQRTLQDAIENLLVKERLDLPPNLRQLDAEIEQAELAIRARIVAEMADGRGSIPEHVQQKIKERIQRDAKKNPAMDLDYYDHLAGKLEYADLRELQDIILAKINWEMFQGCFASKELLMAKFSQLAELRNRIRHSRAVDQVFLKEGEHQSFEHDDLIRCAGLRELRQMFLDIAGGQFLDRGGAARRLAFIEGIIAPIDLALEPLRLLG